MPTVVQNQLADRNGVSGPYGALVGAATTQTSQWFRLSGLRPWSLTVTWNQTGTFTVRLHVTNDPTPTAGNVNTPQLGSDITNVTGSTALAFAEGYQHAMVELNAVAGGAVVSAYLLVG